MCVTYITKIPAFTSDVWFVALVALAVRGIDFFLLATCLVVQGATEGSIVWAENSTTVVWAVWAESLPNFIVSDLDVAGAWEIAVVVIIIVVVMFVVAGIEVGLLVVKMSTSFGKVIKLFVIDDVLFVVVVVVDDVVLVVTEVLLIINSVVVVSLVGFLFGAVVVTLIVDSLMETTVCPGFFGVEIISAVD